MRTFKRPMFRKGGNVGDGIMTGIVDRSMHAADPFVGDTDQFPKIDATSAVQDTSENIDTSLPSEGRGVEYLSEEFSAKPVDIGKPKSVEEYLATLKEGAGEYGGMDPLTSFLLTAGPSVAGATNFADAINRLQPATKQLIKGADAKAKYNRDLRMAATKLALGAEEKSEDKRFKLNLQDMDQENQVKFLNDQRAYARLEKQDKRDYDEAVTAKARAYQKLDDQQKKEYEQRLIDQGRAFELEQIKRKEDFEIDKLEKTQKFQKELYDLEKEEAKKYTEKDFIKVYEGDTLQAKNRADFENEKLKIKAIEKFGSQYEGFLNGPNDPQQDTMEKKGNNKKIGKVYYDVNIGKFKIYNKKTDGTYGFELVKDIDTYTIPDAPAGSTQKEKDAKIDKRFEVLSDEQRKILEEIQKNKPDDFGTGA